MARRLGYTAIAAFLVGCGDTPEGALRDIEGALATRDYVGVEFRVDVHTLADDVVARSFDELATAIPDELTAEERASIRVRASRRLASAVEDAIEEGALIDAMNDGRFWGVLGLPAVPTAGEWRLEGPIGGGGEARSEARFNRGRVGDLVWDRPHDLWRIVGFEPEGAFLRVAGLVVDLHAAESWGALLVLEADLYELVADQRAHRRGEYQFSADAERTGWRGRPGVEIEIIGASERGWAARGTHGLADGFTCGVFVGQAFAATPGLVLGGPDGALSGVVYCG